MVRHKNRYIVVEVNPVDEEKAVSFTTSKFYNAIIKKLEQLHGDFGVAAIRNGFTAKYVNEKTRIGIVKARHGPHKLVASALPCINTLDKTQVYFTTLYTGATIRQCFKFVINYQQEKVNEVCATLKTEEEKAAYRTALISVETMREF